MRIGDPVRTNRLYEIGHPNRRQLRGAVIGVAKDGKRFRVRPFGTRRKRVALVGSEYLVPEENLSSIERAFCKRQVKRFAEKDQNMTSGRDGKLQTRQPVL